MVVRPDETDEEIMARALQIMHATIQRRDEEIATLKPKAEYTDQVLDSITCLTTTQVAKGMGMTANELNRILCQKHIQYGQSGQYLLYAPFARQGLAQNRTRTFRDLFGAVHTTSQLVWTERGRQFIHQLVNPMSDERLANFAIKREQSQACLSYAEPTHEIRAEDASILCLMRRRKTKSIVS